MSRLSLFARRFSRETGIVRVMEDLGERMAADTQIMMLGGGNPAHIPEAQAIFRHSLQTLLDDPASFSHLIGNYASPQGELTFIRALARLLRKEYGWQVEEDNIVLTAGSQGGFFLLFNLLAGAFPDGRQRRILLPGVPEYIGYSDIGIAGDLFYSFPSRVEELGEHEFKYHTDFSALALADDTSAICVSRPTNPTGNVLTDEEIHHLHTLARQHDIPLVIDNAYGDPFPHILFTSVEPIWDEHIIYCMSLSKLGLPGTRTGIIIARREIAQALTRMNAVTLLATGNLGPMLVEELLSDGELLRLSREVIGPYYQARAATAVAYIHEKFSGLNYRLHRPEGALFLWLWLPGLSIGSEALYQRLKARGVLVIPGHYFFPGLDTEWSHRNECLRLSYATVDKTTLQRAIDIIAEELHKL